MLEEQIDDNGQKTGFFRLGGFCNCIWGFIVGDVWACARVVAVVKFDYPHNPLHFRAMVLLRRAAKTLTCADQAEFVEILATCRLLRGETGTYDPWHTTLYVFDGLYRATESLAEMGLSKDEINAALCRLDTEMELKHLLGAKMTSTCNPGEAFVSLEKGRK